MCNYERMGDNREKAQMEAMSLNPTKKFASKILAHDIL